MLDAANFDQWVSGVGRDSEYSRCLVVYFNRVPSDDDMRRLHDAARTEFMKAAAGVTSCPRCNDTGAVERADGGDWPCPVCNEGGDASALHAAAGEIRALSAAAGKGLLTDQVLGQIDAALGIEVSSCPPMDSYVVAQRGPQPGMGALTPELPVGVDSPAKEQG